MNNFLHLLNGEIVRLVKYKVLPIALLTSLIWIAIIFLLNKEEARGLMPSLMIMDIGMMSVILIGASLFLEKQENSLKSLLVAPVNFHQIILAKIISSTLLGIISALVVSLSAYFIHGISINYFLLILYSLLGTGVHVLIGICLSLISKDFTKLLINYVIFACVFTIPSLLNSFGLFSINLDYILLISPTQCAQVLINSLVLNNTSTTELIIAIIYIVGLSIGLYWKFIYKNFKIFAIGG
jgi:fluoroquinolone transport system permease protein